MRTWSLKTRMTVVSSVVLVLAFTFIFFIIESAYTIASKSRIQESLTAQMYSLMAIAEDRDAQLTLPELLKNDRLNHLNSGLIAYVLDVDGDLIWRSRSSDTYSVLPDVSLEYSMGQLTEANLDGREMFWIGNKITWEHENSMEGEYLFLIGERQSLLNEAVRKFKREILVWLSLTAIVLIIVLAYALNVSLKPLREAQEQIELVSRGDAEKVYGDYPDELLPLTSSINRLLEGELNQKSRYRDALGNLAHSLKTPLAIIKTELHQYAHDETYDLLQKQVERIDDIVRYQLNRSVVTAGQTLRRKALIEPEVKKIVDALNKVHAQKSLIIEHQVEPHCYFPGDQGDLMELVGNLADNACKWATSKVAIKIKSFQTYIVISVEDDGFGVPSEKRAIILDRGKRLDQKAEGQGLGLSIVMDIIKTYHGEIAIDSSELGGAMFSLKIPY